MTVMMVTNAFMLANQTQQLSCNSEFCTSHLVDRNSSVTTGVAGASINIENLTMVRWWTNEEFSDKIFLDAAEAYFFDQLEPMLRSRGKSSRVLMIYLMIQIS